MRPLRSWSEAAEAPAEAAAEAPAETEAVVADAEEVKGDE